MTMFRVGPAGIPASLKTDMNAVLNKKFGTTGQNYPPAGWPDDVNLLGPLPVKTASGAVAAFSDGADDVSLKKLEINIDPNLDGVSSVGIVHTGKNLIDNSADAWENGTINYIGNNVSGSGIRTKGYFDVKGGGKFTLSGVIAPSDNSDFRVFFYDKNNDFISYQGYRTEFTIPENARYFRIRNISIEDISHLQIEYGSTATAYEPYIEPATYTAALGQTIYGGTADIVNGTGTDENVLIDMGTLTWTYHPAGSVYSDFFDCYLPSDSIKGTSSIAFNGYTEDYVSIPSNNIAKGTYTNGVMALAGSSRRFIICDTRYTSAEALTTALRGKYLSYPLETPETFTFDPVPVSSYLGDNSIWSDVGDVIECQYYADIDLALQAVSGSRGLMMSSLRSAEPMIGEESDPEEVNKLVEESDNKETEGDNDAR